MEGHDSANGDKAGAYEERSEARPEAPLPRWRDHRSIIWHLRGINHQGMIRRDAIVATPAASAATHYRSLPLVCQVTLI
jgi:hypothetical protein